MTTPADAHPPPEVLHAFSCGTLEAGAAAQVVRHLDGCTVCRNLVAALAGNTFVERLRAAREGTPAPESVNAFSKVAPATAPVTAGTAPDPADLPPELRDHEQYQVERELGRGGMGVVYLVTNRLMQRREVLKVMGKSLLSQPDLCERFLRELRAAALLSHKNIVTAYAALRVGDVLAFTMEYVEGDDLDKVVARSGGALPVVNACYYVQQAAVGLQHAFEKGLVHRDIKPGNLLLAREGKKHVVKIADFGLAKLRGDATAAGDLTGAQTLGTPAYMAPEQWSRTAEADIRADIYSLGCTLYTLLTGKPPFPGPGIREYLRAHEKDAPPPLNELRPEVPPELAAVALKMLAKDPAQRYQTPGEAAQALLPFLKPGSRSGAAEPTPPARQPGPSTPTRLPVEKPSQATTGPWPGPTAKSGKSRLIAAALGLVPLALLGLWASGVFSRNDREVGKESRPVAVGSVQPPAQAEPAADATPSTPSPPEAAPALPAKAKLALLTPVQTELGKMNFPVGKQEGAARDQQRRKALQALAEVVDAVNEGQPDAEVGRRLDRLRREVNDIRQAGVNTLPLPGVVLVEEALRQINRAAQVLRTGQLPPPGAEAGLAELALAREQLSRLTFHPTSPGPAHHKQRMRWLHDLAEVMHAVDDGKADDETWARVAAVQKEVDALAAGLKLQTRVVTLHQASRHLGAALKQAKGENEPAAAP